MQRALLVVLVLVAAVVALTGEASAAGAWYTCTVDQAGPSGNNPYPATTSATPSGSFIYLTDTAAAPAWVGSKQFSISAARAREFLAVGLAAIASGKKVKVFFIFPANLTAVPVLTAIYLEAN